MASLIEGNTYDIFVSYRQKDNKHDGWVTEFVNNLKGELDPRSRRRLVYILTLTLMTDFWRPMMWMHL